jgi:hypothetical protein
MADKYDNRLKSNRTWIKRNNLNNGGSLTYCNKNYHTPNDEKELKNSMNAKMNKNDNKERKRLKVAEPKKSRVKHEDVIDKVKK